MMRLFPCAVVVSLSLCLAVQEGYGIDATLQEVRLDLLAGNREDAAGMCAAWLGAHAGSPAAPLMFLRYFDLEQSLPALIDASRSFLKSAPTGASLPGALLRIARLFEVAGLTEEARDAYLSALSQGASDSALESAFLLSLEMNDGNSLQSAMAGLKDAAGDRTELLAACLAYQEGDSAPAAQALMRIAASSSDQSVALKALWLRYQIAVRSGDQAGRREAARLLGIRFPRSPEYALAALDDPSPSSRPQAAVSLMAQPGSFLGGAPAPLPASLPISSPQTPTSPATSAPSAPAPAQAAPPTGADAPARAAPGTAPAASAPVQAAPAPSPTAPAPAQVGAADKPAARTLSVQAGSFQMKENADDLISGLVKGGFTPTLRSDAAQGKVLYRVFVGRGLSADEAHALLDKLHQAGFSGFLTTDQ